MKYKCFIIKNYNHDLIQENYQLNFTQYLKHILDFLLYSLYPSQTVQQLKNKTQINTFKWFGQKSITLYLKSKVGF